MASATLVAVVLVILFGPVLMLALFSFNDSSIISLPWEGFTTHWYEDAWDNQQARDAILNSLIVASIVTVASRSSSGTAAAWGAHPAALPRPRSGRAGSTARCSSCRG